MIHQQVRNNIIQPVLEDLDLYTEDAEELLIFTMAHESKGGKYIKQLGNGPAMGIYQMENETHDDVWSSVLKYRSDLAEKVNRWTLPGSFPYDNAYEMCGNHYYATAMARCQLFRFDELLPDKDDIDGLAHYWKEYWCRGCQGTKEEAIRNYKEYIGTSAK